MPFGRPWSRLPRFCSAYAPTQGRVIQGAAARAVFPLATRCSLPFVAGSIRWPLHAAPLPRKDSCRDGRGTPAISADSELPAPVGCGGSTALAEATAPAPAGGRPPACNDAKPSCESRGACVAAEARPLGREDNSALGITGASPNGGSGAAVASVVLCMGSHESAAAAAGRRVAGSGPLKSLALNNFFVARAITARDAHVCTRATEGGSAPAGLQARLAHSGSPGSGERDTAQRSAAWRRPLATPEAGAAAPTPNPCARGRGGVARPARHSDWSCWWRMQQAHGRRREGCGALRVSRPRFRNGLAHTSFRARRPRAPHALTPALPHVRRCVRRAQFSGPTCTARRRAGAVCDTPDTSLCARHSVACARSRNARTVARRTSLHVPPPVSGSGFERVRPGLRTTRCA